MCNNLYVTLLTMNIGTLLTRGKRLQRCMTTDAGNSIEFWCWITEPPLLQSVINENKQRRLQQIYNTICMHVHIVLYI